MAKFNAYWISPEGEIFEVRVTHISSIFDNPEFFGLEIDQIRSVYDSFKEKYRFEGKARKQIIESLLDSNWIRIRYNVKQNSWHVNYGVDLEMIISRISKWFKDFDILQGLPSFTLIPTHGDVINIHHRQLEKFLFDKDFFKQNKYLEKKCLNCIHSTWAVGAGQGFFCTNEKKLEISEVNISSTGFKRFFIPSRDYVCEFHEFS